MEVEHGCCSLRMGRGGGGERRRSCGSSDPKCLALGGYGYIYAYGYWISNSRMFGFLKDLHFSCMAQKPSRCPKFEGAMAWTSWAKDKRGHLECFYLRE